jgi:transcription initiation factor TFIIIB Brf1 subunit/transcription initiation factor TFIIB
MEEYAERAVNACPTCRDLSLVQYEELLGGFVCIGCGAVLSEAMITEIPSSLAEIDKNTQVGGNFVSIDEGHRAYLSAGARQTSDRPIYKSSQGFKRRQRIHRVCQQLGLPGTATEEALNLTSTLMTQGVSADAACIYTVCRRHERSVTFAEVCSAACAPLRSSGHCLRRLRSATERGDEHRFIQRALKALNGTFVDEKRSLVLLHFISSHDPLVRGHSPHISAYVAVFLAISSKRQVPSLSDISQKLSIAQRTLQERILKTKKALVTVAQILPIGTVVTLSNISHYLDLILEHLPLLKDLLPTEKDVRFEAIAKDYADTIEKFGPRTADDLPEAFIEDSGSELDLMSDDEARAYMRTDQEIQDLLTVHNLVGRS